MEEASIGEFDNDLEPFLLDILGGNDLDIHPEILEEVYDRVAVTSTENNQQIQQPIEEHRYQAPVNYSENQMVVEEISYEGARAMNSPNSSQFSQSPTHDLNFSPPKIHPESPPFVSSGLTPPHQSIEEIPQPDQLKMERSNLEHQKREQIIINRSPGEQSQKQQPVYIIPISGPQMVVKSDMGGQKKPKKVERNKAHNAIEKRYRHSINDRIDELRQILGGRDQKMSKRGINKSHIIYSYYRCLIATIINPLKVGGFETSNR